MFPKVKKGVPAEDRAQARARRDDAMNATHAAASDAAATPSATRKPRGDGARNAASRCTRSTHGVGIG